MTLEQQTPAPKRKKKHISVVDFIVRLILTLLFLVAGPGAAIKYQIDFGPYAPTGVWNDIKGIPMEYQYTYLKWQQDMALSNKLKQPIPTTFDNTADDQLVEAGINMEPATAIDLALLPDSITTASNPIDSNGFLALPKLTVLIPFLLNDGDRISISKTYTTWTAGVAGKEIGITAAAVKLIVPLENTEIIPGIIDPKAVLIELFKLPIHGNETFAGAIINVTRNDGIKYEVGFSARDFDQPLNTLIPLPILDNAPTWNNNQNIKGLPISGTTPIMKTGITNALIEYGGSRINPSYDFTDTGFSSIQFSANSNGKALYLPLHS